MKNIKLRREKKNFNGIECDLIFIIAKERHADRTNRCRGFLIIKYKCLPYAQATRTGELE